MVYDIFTYDFWRIKARKKPKVREKTLDVWYIVNFEIETQEWRDIHKIKNIKIISEFPYQGKDFAIIHEYLALLHTIITHIPHGIDVKEIFWIIEAVNEKKHINVLKLNLARLKVLDIVWILDCEHSDRQIRVILDFIQKNRISEILKLKSDSWDISDAIQRLSRH